MCQSVIHFKSIRVLCSSFCHESELFLSTPDSSLHHDHLFRSFLLTWTTTCKYARAFVHRYYYLKIIIIIYKFEEYINIAREKKEKNKCSGNVARFDVKYNLPGHHAHIFHLGCATSSCSNYKSLNKLNKYVSKFQVLNYKYKYYRY